MWIGSEGFIWVDQLYIAAAHFAISLSPLLWYRWRLRMFSNIEQQHRMCLERLESGARELKTLEGETRQIEEDIHKLTGKNEISAEDLDRRAAELDRLLKLGEELRRGSADTARADAELAR